MGGGWSLIPEVHREVGLTYSTWTEQKSHRPMPVGQLGLQLLQSLILDLKGSNQYALGDRKKHRLQVYFPLWVNHGRNHYECNFHTECGVNCKLQKG